MSLEYSCNVTWGTVVFVQSSRNARQERSEIFRSVHSTDIKIEYITNSKEIKMVTVILM